MKCECCESVTEVELECGRTMYPTELPAEHPDNPNRSVLLCRPCAGKHHEHWDEMWANV
jgi:hypothetical protein